MSTIRTQWVWFSGKLVPWEEATLHVSTHGLHYGTGVFEGIRCYNTDDGPAVFRLGDHIERLQRSASAYFALPFTAAEIEAGCLELIAANGLKECYLRPIAWLGAGGLGVGRSDNPVELAILSFPWDSYLGEKALREGVDICLSRWHRISLAALPMNLKACGQYLNSFLAVTEARRRGFDEALMLNDDGSISEGSGENLFLVRDGRLTTNGADAAILPGITRDSVLTLARELGIEASEGPITPASLRIAVEAFFTGTAAEVTPIRSIDLRTESQAGEENGAGEVVNYGAPGTVTKRLQQAYFDAIRGRNARLRGWLTPAGPPVAAKGAR
jgi:branched-chain amino acid aminotransferase